MKPRKFTIPWHTLTLVWETYVWKKRMLVELDESVNVNVLFDDDYKVLVKGKGNILIHLKYGRHKFISIAYYVPNLKNSILSFKQLLEKNYDIHKKDLSLSIKHEFLWISLCHMYFCWGNLNDCPLTWKQWWSSDPRKLEYLEQISRWFRLFVVLASLQVVGDRVALVLGITIKTSLFIIVFIIFHHLMFESVLLSLCFTFNHHQNSWALRFTSYSFLLQFSWTFSLIFIVQKVSFIYFPSYSLVEVSYPASPILMSYVHDFLLWRWVDLKILGIASIISYEGCLYHAFSNVRPSSD